MHSINLIVICLFIGNDGLGENIGQRDSFPSSGNTSTSNQEISRSEARIGSPTNPPSQTTGIAFSGIHTQSSKAENIMNSTSTTESAPQVSGHQTLPQPISPTQHYSDNTTTESRNSISNTSGTLSPPVISVTPTQRYSNNLTESRNVINNTSRFISPEILRVTPTQHYPNNPTQESRNAISNPSGEGDEATPTRTVRQELGQVPPIHSITRRPFLPVNPPVKQTTPSIGIPSKSKTASISKPTTKPTQHSITKPDLHSVITKKNSPFPIKTTPVVSTLTIPCSSYTGTLLKLVFENNSQLCRKQIEEIQEGIWKYASELNVLKFSDSVLVLNGCDICKARNDTQTVTFKFCIQTERSCNIDATKNIWNRMDDQKELDKLETYIPVKIVSTCMYLTPTKQDPLNVVPLSVGLLGVAFLLIFLFAIFIFRGKTKKSLVKDRFYFDDSTIQDCLDSAGNGNESYCLDRVKDRELKHKSLLVPAINLGLDIDEEHKLENEFPSHLLSVNALKMYYTYKEAIDEEFKSLPYFRPSLKELPVGVGSKNRTAHVLPPLDTRVLLSSRIDCNGYINANQIKGYQSSKVAYIATQAPLSNTCADFWHMVWEQQSRVIVMLCTPDEIGKNVQQYWPKNHGMEGALLFGDILVSLEAMTSSEHHTVSNLVVKDIEKNLCRPISHYWFSWPADGVPGSPSDITGLLLHIRESITENQGPMVVHCSDGVGRTGTLITIDISMRVLEDTTHVDVPHTTCMVRKDRGAGVENPLQYNYIYQALYDYSQRLSRANQQVGW